MRKILLIVNPVAGNGNTLKNLAEVKSYFNIHADRIALTIKISRFKNDISLLAKEYYECGIREFLVMGGDGTISELVNGLAHTEDSSIKIGIFPHGSGNDFVKSVYGKFVLNDFLKSIVEDKTRLIDIGKVNNYYFINSCTLGIDGPIIKQTDLLKKKIPGNLAYYISTVMKGMIFESKNVKVNIDGNCIKGKQMLIAVCNGKYIGGGMKIAPKANLKSGDFSICLIKDVKKSKFARHIKKVYNGTLNDLEEVSYYKGKDIMVDIIDGKYDINVDGNLIDETPAKISIIKDGINVFCM
jgi:YegS/Rv2252/BmrU family lipid kinase